MVSEKTADASPSSRRALVVGLGIAGMSAALSLASAGWTPVIVERAPQRRTGGYMVGMFPPGIVAAKALGVNDSITKRTVPGAPTLQIDADGTRSTGPGFTDQPGAPETVLRGDIEAGLWEHIRAANIDVRFGLTPTRIAQHADHAEVVLESAFSNDSHTERFDLVVGADGLRSTVRRLAFGPDERFMKPLKAIICAFQLSGPSPTLSGEDSAIIAAPNRALWIFGMKDTNPTVLFTYRTKHIDAQFAGDRAEALRAAYHDVDGGGLVPAAIDEFAAAPHSLFDSVHQVRMRRWHRGRVVLVGDSAWCLTLYSGMGATAGMLGGTALGEALANHPRDLATALDAYDRRMRKFVAMNLRTVPVKSQFFVPTGYIGWRLRRWLLNSKLLSPDRLAGTR